jgi:hypothetical protein
MIYSRQYSRQLLILKSVNATNANGRCIIEIKNAQGKLIINTYNLNKENVYNVYFVLNDAKTAFKVGTLLPSEQKSISFSPDDIGGNKIEDMCAVAVGIPSSQNVILAGYIGDFVDLKGGIVLSASKPQQPQSEILSASSVSCSPQKQNENAGGNASAKDTQKNVAPRVDFMEMFNKFRRDIEELESLALAKETDESDENSDVAQNVPSDCIILNYCDYIRQNRPSAKPFNATSDDFEWYEISPSDLSPIYEIPLDIILNPYIYLYNERHGNILFGIGKNEKQYSVAVACERCDEIDTRYFKQFIPSQENTDVGYRIFVSAKN